MGYVLERAEAIAPLTIEHGNVRWAGRSDPEPDAPILRFECTLADGEEVGDLVARYPMPATLIAELAERFVDVSLDVGALRWRRALVAARLARGEQLVEIGQGETTVRVPGPIRDARVTRDGTLLVTTGGGATIDGRVVLPPPETDQFMMAVPRPHDPACAQHVAVSRVYGSNELEVRAFDRASGEHVGSYSGVAPGGFPAAFTVANGGWWFHEHDSQLFVGRHRDPFTIETWMQWAIVARWLFVRSGNVWQWHALDRDQEPRTIRLEEHTPTLVVVGNVLWIGAAQGLFRAEAGEDPERVFEGRVDGVAVDGAHAWLGSLEEIIALDLPSCGVRWRTKLAHGAWTITRIAAGVVAAGHDVATVLDDTGQILVVLEPGAPFGLKVLADGTAAISVGEYVAIVAPDGVVYRPPPLPYDGSICDATIDRFVFGPLHRDSRLRPDAYYALDRTGAITARLPFENPSAVKLVGCSDTHVFVRLDGAIVQWDARGVAATGLTAAPPPRRDAERGRVSRAGPIRDPRMDTPCHGVEVTHDTLLIDGVYGGSTGEYLTQAPFRVSDGAIATFYRCDLREGDAYGEVVSRGATAILVACRVPANVTWTASPDGHLVMIDCVAG